MLCLSSMSSIMRLGALYYSLIAQILLLSRIIASNAESADDEHQNYQHHHHHGDDDDGQDNGHEPEMTREQIDALIKAWGETIEWHEDLDAAIERAKAENKPIMLVVHREWCPVCKDLSPKFAASADISQLSSKFVMASLWKDDEPAKPEYQEEGAYVPRILFLHRNGRLMKAVKNSQNEKRYFYFYVEVEPIISSMKRALELHEAQKHLPDPPEPLADEHSEL